jgi:hypothetical protein
MSATLEGYHVAHRRSRTLTVTDSGNSDLELPATFDELPATGDRVSWMIS